MIIKRKYSANINFKGVKCMVKLQQLFCRHNWQAVDSYRFSQWMDGIKNECLSEIQECPKCGKKRSYFISMPHDAPLLRSW